MISRILPFLTCLMLITCINNQKAYAQYVKADQVLTAGHPVTVAVSQSDTLIITYRPGSNIAEKSTVVIKDSSYQWEPQQAGIIKLSTPSGPSQTVSVRFDRFPIPGFIVLIIAGSILFGGATYASVKLFGKTSSDAITDRPDT